MFVLSRLVQQLTMHRQIEEWADQLAAACLDRVFARILPTATQLNRAQARGYVRARALAVVHAELPNNALPARVHDHLRELALERLVHRTLASLDQQRRVEPLRRAA